MRSIRLAFGGGEVAEFNVDWTVRDVLHTVTRAMSDDGFLFIPGREDEGWLVNLSRCNYIAIGGERD